MHGLPAEALPPLRVLVVLLLLAPTAFAAGEAHSASVRDAWHEPAAPARGHDVVVHVRLAPEAAPSAVSLIYCRVQDYACALPVVMTAVGDAGYTATIPWRDAFFRGVRDVGYSFIVRFADGSTEHSPTANWPTTPAALAQVDATYYFYSLPEESRLVPDAGWVALAAFACASLVRVRGRDAWTR